MTLVWSVLIFSTTQDRRGISEKEDLRPSLHRTRLKVETPWNLQHTKVLTLCILSSGEMIEPGLSPFTENIRRQFCLLLQFMIRKALMA